MTKFTTRVELHDADSDDYEKLHAEMEWRGFKRFITDNEGVKYHLPTAEYNYEGEDKRSVVLDKAKEAAKATKLRYSILVTESNGRVWFNLDKA